MYEPIKMAVGRPQQPPSALKKVDNTLRDIAAVAGAIATIGALGVGGYQTFNAFNEHRLQNMAANDASKILQMAGSTGDLKNVADYPSQQIHDVEMHPFRNITEASSNSDQSMFFEPVTGQKRKREEDIFERFRVRPPAPGMFESSTKRKRDNEPFSIHNYFPRNVALARDLNFRGMSDEGIGYEPNFDFQFSRGIRPPR
jgi:hypothetical protein